MYRFLLSRQWVTLTLIALLLIPAMVWLGFWQLHRHEQRAEHNAQIADSLAATPTPVDRLTSPRRPVSSDERYRPVTASGTYDTRHEVVVRQRTGTDENRVGYHVLTPLQQPDGTTVLVNRGWIAPGDDLTSFPDVPPAPAGQVRVTGLLLPDETTASSGIKERSGLPDRQVMLINSRELALDGPVHSGYIQLTATSPRPRGEQPAPLPTPDHSSVGPHLAYTFNWWLLAAGVPLGWVILMRRELHDQRTAGERRVTAAGPVLPGTEAAPVAPASSEHQVS